MGVIPEVKIKPTTTRMVSQPGMAGTVAVIGAFDNVSTEEKVYSFNTLTAAQEELTTLEGYDIFDKLFRRDSGASSLLCVNITTNGTSDTKETEMTNEKLVSALNLLKGEKYDILFIAAELTDEGLTTVKEFLDDAYDLQKPVGVIAPLNRASDTLATASAKIFESGGLYGLITQKFTLTGNKILSLVESAAYYCGVVAGLKIDQSMTMSQLPDVINVSPEYGYSDNEEGYNLVTAGITVVRCMDRINNKYVVVNSELPSGLDLYIERTKDYVIRDICLEEFLGDKSTSNTITAIKSMIETKKQLFINTLSLLEDLNYNVEKESPKCVNVYLDSLVFAGVITTINIHVVVEVE